MIQMTVAPSRLILTLITLIALGSSLRDASAQGSACASQIKTIEINKATLHYFECGEGEPIVFVHGTLGDLNVFRIQAQTFATRFRVNFLQPALSPAQRSTSGSRCLSSERSCGRPWSAGKGTESHSSTSGCVLLWRVHRARADGGSSRARSQPGSRRAARAAFYNQAVMAFLQRRLAVARAAAVECHTSAKKLWA